MKKNKLFCFGLGYVSTNLVETYGFKKMGTSTSDKKNYLFNSTQNFDGKILYDYDYILVSIPPVGNQDIVYKFYNNYLKSHKTLKWIGVLSSTSVYGNYNGEEVTERSRTNPDDARGMSRLAMENIWLNSGLPVNIFRIAGIYGRGRSIIEKIKNKKLLRVSDVNNIMNRIHIKDLIAILYSSMEKQTRHEIYNVADDYPASYNEVIEYVCDLIGLRYPESVSIKDERISDMLRSFLISNKKISNLKIKSDLDLSLKFPSYKEGYKNIIEQDKLDT